MSKVEKTVEGSIQPDSSVPCEQSENIERFRMKEESSHIFQPVESSSSAIWRKFFISC